MKFQTYHQQTLASRALVDPTVNVEITTIKQCVRVFRDIVVRHRLVAQNVYPVRIALSIKRVAIKNVLTLVKEHVVWKLDVKLLIITRYVLVHLTYQEIHLQDVFQYVSFF